MRFTIESSTIGALALLAVLTTACGGGGGGSSPSESRSDLVLIDVSVDATSGVPLNEIIEFDFSEVLGPDSVRPDTIQIRQGPNFGRQVAGDFRVDGNRVRAQTLTDLFDDTRQR